jgi:hypothetical protein
MRSNIENIISRSNATSCNEMVRLLPDAGSEDADVLSSTHPFIEGWHLTRHLVHVGCDLSPGGLKAVNAHRQTVPAANKTVDTQDSRPARPQNKSQTTRHYFHQRRQQTVRRPASIWRCGTSM